MLPSDYGLLLSNVHFVNYGNILSVVFKFVPKQFTDGPPMPSNRPGGGGGMIGAVEEGLAEVSNPGPRSCQHSALYTLYFIEVSG